MAGLSSFMSVSLDGYFASASGDISWAHNAPDDAEWSEFVAGNASGSGTLLFGRVTYDMMAAWWPTDQAKAAMPEVARGMNEMRKVVASRTLAAPTWQNASVLQGELVDGVTKLTRESSEGITILGSGSIVSQLSEAGLIDEYHLIVVPVVLGEGRRMFDGPNTAMKVRLGESRTFRNGNVSLRYERIR